MGNAEIFAGDGLVKISPKRLARHVCNGVDDAIQTIPGLLQCGKHCGNFFVVADIAGEDQIRAKFRRHFLHPLAHAFTLVRKRQLCTFSMHCFGNAIGNRAIAQHAGNQNSFVCQHSHAMTFKSSFGRSANLSEAEPVQPAASRWPSWGSRQGDL